MIPENVRNLMYRLQQNGFEAYVIGGAVRDHLLGLQPKDFDVFTNATGDQILAIFPHGKVVGGEERQAKILTVIVDGVEISQYRKNGDRTETGHSFIDHVSTCDFTVNAIAWDAEGNTFDHVDGRTDLRLGYLTFVGQPMARIREDPLRLFRGVRMMAKYNLIPMLIEHEKPFFEFKEHVETLPKERIRDELMKIIPHEDGFRRLDYYGMLAWILPEWQKCKEHPGGKYHGEALGEHMFLTLDTARTLTSNPLLLLAAFLHDVGKPTTADEKPDTITFHGHHHTGADYIRKWMREYKFSEKDIDYVATVIRHHMAWDCGELGGRAFARICNDLRTNGVAPEDLVVQMYSDNQANLLRPRQSFNEFAKNNGFLQRYYELLYSHRGFNVNDLEVTGQDIMAIGFPAGREIGEMKNRLFDAVCEGKLINRKDRLLEELIKIRNERGR